MRSIICALITAGVALAAYPAAAPASPTPMICVVPPTGSLAGPPTPTIQPPAPVGTIRPTVGTGGPTTTVPGAVLITPQRPNTAIVVPTQTTRPFVPGAPLVSPAIIVPPTPVPGQNRTLITAQQLQAAGGPGAAMPACYTGPPAR